jgi:regulator of RNase E activity RraB
MNRMRQSSFATLLVLGSLAGCSREASDPDDVPDSVVVENLAGAGSDVSKPHDIDFTLYFPEEAAARRVGAKLTSEGFVVAVDFVEEDGDEDAFWSIEATKSMVPDPDEITKVGQSLRTLAESEGGEYDGWGAAVVP